MKAKLQSSETCRAPPSNKDSKNVIYIGGCPNFQGGTAAKMTENESITENSVIMHTGKWAILD